jgi:hypothetical protein
MNYDILKFKDFVQVQADLNHLRHKLKSPMADEERVQLFNQISDKTKEVMHHLNILHQGALGEVVEIEEDGVAVAGPTNVVGRGAISGTGGAGGEPGVHLPKKKKNPVIMSMLQRKPTKMT